MSRRPYSLGSQRGVERPPESFNSFLHPLPLAASKQLPPCHAKLPPVLILLTKLPHRSSPLETLTLQQRCGQDFLANFQFVFFELYRICFKPYFMGIIFFGSICHSLRILFAPRYFSRLTLFIQHVFCLHSGLLLNIFSRHYIFFRITGIVCRECQAHSTKRECSAIMNVWKL